MSIDVSQFHQVFFEESFEGLDAMEMGLLGLSEGEPDVEAINTIFRAAHSIKGGAGTFGFTEISEFTHALETLLDEMRNGSRDVTSDGVNISLQAVDVLREMLNAVQQDAEADQDRVQAVSEQLQALLEGEDDTSVDVVSDVATDMVAETDTASTGWKIDFVPNIDMLQTGNDPVRLLHELSELGEMTVKVNEQRLPAFTDLVPEDCYLDWTIELTGDIPESAITEIFEWVEGDCTLTLTPLGSAEAEIGEPSIEEAELQAEAEQPVLEDVAAASVETDVEEAISEPEPITSLGALPADEPVLAPAVAAKKPVPAPEPKPQAEAKKQVSNDNSGMASIRVGTEKVDSLINLVGELVITQSMLTQMGENFDSNQLPQLLDGLEQLERNTRELQEGIMRIRMLPISFAFNRFPRLVHDLSAKMGKKVELKLTGEQTELDKTVMEKIGDPLVHLVRNSLDHGLEKPEKRIEAGKPETGLLQLNAYHQGGNIVIEIVDDGGGLNEDKILSKAIERGLVSEADNLPPEKIHELIFLPGFSTADVISDVSGRGVGMDVVRKNIQALGGNIEIKSERGKGSTFTIRLPLTLAIMDGQIIQVAGQKYIVPLISIIESVEIKENTVKKVAGKGEVFKLRDEYMPFIRLYEVFNLKPQIDRLEDGLLVVVENENGKVGLFIDDLLSQQQIVIKSLETNYRNVTGLAGATILGDGMVALILDVAGLVSLYKNTSAQDKHGRIEAA